jgi:hypothetical protein
MKQQAAAHKKKDNQKTAFGFALRINHSARKSFEPLASLPVWWGRTIAINA